MDTPINAPLRKLPIGIQSFEKLRSENFLYVDKTALIYRLGQSLFPEPSPPLWQKPVAFFFRGVLSR